MRPASVMRVTAIAVALQLTASHAFPGERDLLNACQALVDRAARAEQADTPGNAADAAELQRCRQIIKEWTLRDSRMSVDEQGRPLR